MKFNKSYRTCDIYHGVYKISKPEVGDVVMRRRLFRILDSFRSKPVIWLSGVPGAGKTILAVSYLNSRKIPYLYYRMEGSDTDLATFFYYLGMALGNARSGKTPFGRYSGTRAGQLASLPLLTPEYRLDVPAFTRWFFNEFYGMIGHEKRLVIVFDNYQEVPADSMLHAVIGEGLSMLPEDVHAVIISKGDPPPAFTPLRMGNKMGFVTDKEVRFTLPETVGLLHRMGIVRPGTSGSKQFHEMAEGWAAGLVLLTEEYRRVPAQQKPSLPDKALLSERLFGYFADHIFGRLDKELQDFLLRTSFLTKVTAAAAREMTGAKHPEDILGYLHRNNYFTVKLASPEPAYHYHSLFREFLLSHARATFTEDELRSVMAQAARLLAQSGEFEEAAKLLARAGAWPDFTSLVVAHAPSLLAQGRNQVLIQWFKQMDQKAVAGNPWLLYWYGLSIFPFSLPESRAYLEKAFALFKEQSDENGIYLSWANVVRTYCIEWNSFKPIDSWLDTINGFLERVPLPPGESGTYFISVMLLALLYRRPKYEDIAPWLLRAEEIVLSGKGTDMRTRIMIGSYLMLYYSWTGDISKMEVLMNTLRPPFRHYDTRKDTARSTADGQGTITPLDMIQWQIVESIYAWQTLSAEISSAIETGIGIANSYGLHLWDHILYSQGVYYALSVNDMPAAGMYLDKMSKGVNVNSLVDCSHFYYLKSWYSHAQGKLPLAIEYGESALRNAVQAGAVFPEILCRLGLARVQTAAGNYGKARENAARAERLSRDMRCIMGQCYYHLLEAQIAFERGDEERGIESLRQGMKIGREQGYINNWRWMHEPMLFLCLRALRYSIEVPYVRMLIKRRGLLPDPRSLDRYGIDSLSDVENWPWTLDIRTLGGFELIKEDDDGKPVESPVQGKVQKMPLALLKVVIASGGTDVREESVVDALWPEAEGDRTHTAFSTTLQRLRQLMGSERCIRLKEGRLSLDPLECRLDVWEFDRLLDKADALWKHDRDKAVGLIDKAVGLYRGGFLPEDVGAGWTTSMRERMRSKFIRALHRLGHYCEEQGAYDKAAGDYTKGLEADDLSEEFYQSLMLCYHAMGRDAEALSVYRTCRRILHDVLNIAPSSKTESIYRDIKSAPQ